MKTLVAAVISLAHLIAALPAFQHMSSDVFAISAYESGFQHGMNDAAAVCNHRAITIIPFWKNSRYERL
ncbi:MAG: hypothetical protein WBQ25_22140 [Nitrososphaeraceae archaeon]